jgi:hypothetical protein
MIARLPVPIPNSLRRREDNLLDETTAVSMSLTGSRFFFGIGTKALPSWGSMTRRSNLLRA